MDHILTYMTFIPLVGAVIVLCLPSDAKALIKWVSVAATVPPLLLAIWLFVNFDRTTPGFQFQQQMAWIASFNIQYLVGVDGISITMVLLTALLCFLCIFASWGIDKGLKGYFSLFLLLDTGMMGVFVALDFFLFFVFWEVMLLPMYFLIGIWAAARVRGDQVLPLHAARQRPHAARHPGVLFQRHRSGDRPAHVQHAGHDE